MVSSSLCYDAYLELGMELSTNQKRRTIMRQLLILTSSKTFGGWKKLPDTLQTLRLLLVMKTIKDLFMQLYQFTRLRRMELTQMNSILLGKLHATINHCYAVVCLDLRKQRTHTLQTNYNLQLLNAEFVNMLCNLSHFPSILYVHIYLFYCQVSLK